jgi:hypothetical protein
VVAAATASGFKIVKSPSSPKPRNRVELEMENAEVLADSLSRDDKIVVERQGVRVIFSRDARGSFRACVEGDRPQDELRKIGEDLSGRVIQQYVLRRRSDELQQHGFSTLSLDQGPDESIRLHVRRYPQE